MNGNYVFTNNIIKRNHITFDSTNMKRTLDKKNKRDKSPLKLNPFSLNNEFNYGIHNPNKYLSLNHEKENVIKNQDIIKYNLLKKQNLISNEQVADKTTLKDNMKIPSAFLSNPKDNFDVPAYKEQIQRIKKDATRRKAEKGLIEPIRGVEIKRINQETYKPEFLDLIKEKDLIDFTDIDDKINKNLEEFRNSKINRNIAEMAAEIKYIDNVIKNDNELSMTEKNRLIDIKIQLDDRLDNYLKTFVMNKAPSPPPKKNKPSISNPTPKPKKGQVAEYNISKRKIMTPSKIPKPLQTRYVKFT